MKITEAVSLMPGTEIRCKLDCAREAGSWFTGKVIQNYGYQDNGRISINVERGDNYHWNIEVTEDNLHLIEFTDWDSADNIKAKKSYTMAEVEDTRWDQ